MNGVELWIIGGALIVLAVVLRICVDSHPAQTQRWKTLKKWWYRKEKK